MEFEKTSGDIKAIDKKVVHKVCSGQVILSLAIALKELVENSIDAGATVIDIVVKEYGSEFIEVSDNGSGIQKSNFKELALKHYTSKIENFSDLEKLGTLGFRGEALSSLCALAELEIITKHKSDEVASKISYDQNGIIKNITQMARQVGTTATLRNLFSSLPVRKKEFMKNLKREYGKMIQLLTAYCLVSKGIKFTCTNINNKGARQVVLSTQGSQSYRENIISIFGSKQISALIDVDILPPSELILNDFGIQHLKEKPLPFKLEFLISSGMHGSGRSTSDRQFFYINSRPVDSSKIAKVINDAYKEFNANQYPFIFLNIISQDTLVDVNVTPDKRQIFIENEKFLFATLKMSLLEAFKLFPSKILTQSNITTFTDSFTSENAKRKSTGSDFLNNFRKKSKRDSSNINLTFSEMEDIKQVNTADHQKSRICNDNHFVEKEIIIKKELQSNSQTTKNVTKIMDIKVDNFFRDIKLKYVEEKTHEEILPKNDIDFKFEEENILCKNNINNESFDDTKKNDFTITYDDLPCNEDHSRHGIFNINLNDIKNSLKNLSAKKEQCPTVIKFRSKISPKNNKNAEKELQQLKHDDFNNMSVVGQFNLGFIISKLDNDLFIIDQHATDEIYNFEQLQQNSVLEHQSLVNPMPLDVVPGYEEIIAENEDIFRKNGFLFKINMNAPVGKRVLLTAVPVSHNSVFAKEDIHEMMAMLQDASGTMCRPSKIRAIFASKACRKSVMIGKPLTENCMKILVNHMAEIKKPWNCPHGRPTIRHLINLNLLEENHNENNEEGSISSDDQEF